MRFRFGKLFLQSMELYNDELIRVNRKKAAPTAVNTKSPASRLRLPGDFVLCVDFSLCLRWCSEITAIVQFADSIL